VAGRVQVLAVYLKVDLWGVGAPLLVGDVTEACRELLHCLVVIRSEMHAYSPSNSHTVGACLPPSPSLLAATAAVQVCPPACVNQLQSEGPTGGVQAMTCCCCPAGRLGGWPGHAAYAATHVGNVLVAASVLLHLQLVAEPDCHQVHIAHCATAETGRVDAHRSRRQQRASGTRKSATTPLQQRVND
jgi:hypothetical protein